MGLGLGRHQLLQAERVLDLDLGCHQLLQAEKILGHNLVIVRSSGFEALMLVLIEISHCKLNVPENHLQPLHIEKGYDAG